MTVNKRRNDLHIFDPREDIIAVSDRVGKGHFTFSDPYFAAGQIVVVQASNTSIIGKDGLSGKAVGVQSDTTGEVEAKKITGVQLRPYDDISLAFQDLVNGRIDAVIADNPMVYVSRNPNQLRTAGNVFKFKDKYYSIAVCKNRPDLVEKINRGLAALKAGGLMAQLT